MKKYGLAIYKISVLFLLIGAIVLFALSFSKRDELITEKITLKYFENSMNNYDKENLKEFVANSENDILYDNAVQNYELYHYEGVSDYRFTIDDYEVFGNGKYQCFFNLKNVPTCDLDNEGRYMSYLIDTTTAYKTVIGEEKIVKEKGLVVFVKDGSNGNLFEWKLVRYNSYVKE